MYCGMRTFHHRTVHHRTFHHPDVSSLGLFIIGRFITADVSSLGRFIIERFITADVSSPGHFITWTVHHHRPILNRTLHLFCQNRPILVSIRSSIFLTNGQTLTPRLPGKWLGERTRWWVFLWTAAKGSLCHNARFGPNSGLEDCWLYGWGNGYALSGAGHWWWWWIKQLSNNYQLLIDLKDKITAVTLLPLLRAPTSTQRQTQPQLFVAVYNWHKLSKINSIRPKISQRTCNLLYKILPCIAKQRAIVSCNNVSSSPTS